MKIVIFGATGGTGKNVVEQALAAGHEVVAVARRPDAVAPRERLTVRQGDVLDATSVRAALVGASAVISTVGPAKNSQPGTLISEGTKHIVEACPAAGVRRFVFESGLMMSDGSELSFFGRVAIGIFRRVVHKLYADKVIAEEAITASALDWVIVRPPMLNHTPATGQYVAGPRARVSPSKALAHADCAAVLLKAATEPGWVKQFINVGHA
jgi:putative NADH-flavin reductase